MNLHMHKIVPTALLLVATTLGSTGCDQPGTTDDDCVDSSLDEEASEDIVMRLYDEVLTVQDGSAPDDAAPILEEILASDYQSIASNGAQIDEKEASIQGFVGVRMLIPDLSWSVQEVLHDDGRVIVRSRATGTTRGEFLGLELPEAKPFDIMTVDIHTMTQDGSQILETYHVEEWSTAVQQLTAG